MSKETTIKELDSIEIPKKVEKIATPKAVPETETAKQSSIKDKLFSENNIVLLVLLLISFHPGINMYINSLINMGGGTFIVKAVCVVVVYYLYNEYM
jgi:hypothetical protein